MTTAVVQGRPESFDALQALLEGRRPVVQVPEPEPEPQPQEQDSAVAREAVRALALSAAMNLQHAVATLKFLAQIDEGYAEVATAVRKQIPLVEKLASGEATPTTQAQPAAPKRAPRRPVQSIAPEEIEEPVIEEAAEVQVAPGQSKIKAMLAAAEARRRSRPAILRRDEDGEVEEAPRAHRNGRALAPSTADSTVKTQLVHAAPTPPVDDLEDAPDEVPLAVYDPALGDVKPTELTAEADVEWSEPPVEDYPEAVEDVFDMPEETGEQVDE